MPKTVKCSSPLYNLDPVYDKRVLSVGERLRNSLVSEGAMHPLILPGNHHVVTLIVEHYHDLSGHIRFGTRSRDAKRKILDNQSSGSDKSVIKRYFDCKKRQAPVGEQMMADLPVNRVTARKLPFTIVGIVCFGPFTVKRGKSNVKKYGVIFTCLAMRAVHIESRK